MALLARNLYNSSVTGPGNPGDGGKRNTGKFGRHRTGNNAGRPRMPTRRRLSIRDKFKHTRVATAGVGLAKQFDGWFTGQVVDGYRPGLREPELSTGGGKAALQHLVLRPRRNEGNVITIGWVNCANYMAKLRTFECLQQMEHARFRRNLAMRRESYIEFFASAREFFEGEGFRIVIEHEAPDLPGPISRRASSIPAAVAHTDFSWRWAAVTLAFGGTILACFAFVRFVMG